MLGTGIKGLVDFEVKRLAKEIAGKSLSETEILGVWSTIAWGQESSVTKCPWVYTKGEKQGQICGGKLKKDSDYCGLHTKVPKAAVPAAPLPVSRKASLELEGKILLHRHKTLNKLYHQETGMVFESAENKVVIGKIDLKTERFSEHLSPEDTETCNRWRFEIKPKPKPKLTTKKVVEEEEEEDNQEIEIDEGDDSDPNPVVSRALWGDQGLS